MERRVVKYNMRTGCIPQDDVNRLQSRLSESVTSLLHNMMVAPDKFDDGIIVYNVVTKQI